MATIQIYYKNSSGYQLYYPQTDMSSVINLNSTISSMNSTISSNYNTLNNKFSNYYTKTQTLSSTTASSYGLSGSYVPDTAFQYLNTQSYPQIGDVKITARTDLDDSWLLCNGELLFSDQPELLNMLKMNESDDWVAVIQEYALQLITGKNCWFYGDSVKFFENQYVFLSSTPYVSGQNYTNYFIILDQDLKNFTYYEIEGIDNNRTTLNSQWFIYNNQIILTQISSYYNLFQLYIGNNLQGPFIKKNYTSTSGENIDYSGNLIIDDNGYVVILANKTTYSSYSREYTYSIGILYTNSINNTKLSSKFIESTTSDENSMTRVYTNIILKYANGYYVLYIYNLETKQDYIYYTTNLSGTWTKKMYSGGATPSSAEGKLLYDEYDDAWIITNTASDGYYYVKGSPGGNWQKVSTLINPLYFYTFNGQGYFSNTYFYKIQDITTGSFQQLGQISNQVNLRLNNSTPVFLNSVNNYFVSFYNGARQGSSGGLGEINAFVFGSFLPTITLDKVYVYIKGQ